MCCLGFACLAVGVPPKTLKGRSTPLSLNMDIPGLAGGLRSSALSESAMNANDSGGSSSYREEMLTRIFAEGGIALTFEDTAPPELRAAYESGLAGS